jgi:hypothetical protein
MSWEEKMKTYYLPILFLIASGCTSGNHLGPADSPVTNTDTSDQLYMRALTVCDPLSDDQNQTQDIRLGLQGKLYYLTDDMPRFTTVEDYTRAVDTGTTVFLRDVNVPTRMFDRGFPTADGSLIQANGQTLVEWFELYLETQIQLTDGDLPGNYQLAMIADDGATMEIGDFDGVYTRQVDDDGTHSSRLACATSTVALDGSTSIPTRIKYYQGPRTEIALMLLWRRIPDNMSLDEPLCGATGQNLYFEYHDNPSTPQQAYIDLLSRGWAPLKPGNFALPGRQRINPCTDNAHWFY